MEQTIDMNKYTTFHDSIMKEGEGFKILVTNQSDKERIIRAVIAVICVIGGFLIKVTMLSMAFYMIAGALIFNAVSGNCYIYRMLGYSSCPLPKAE